MGRVKKYFLERIRNYFLKNYSDKIIKQKIDITDIFKFKPEYQVYFTGKGGTYPTTIVTIKMIGYNVKKKSPEYFIQFPNKITKWIESGETLTSFKENHDFKLIDIEKFCNNQCLYEKLKDICKDCPIMEIKNNILSDYILIDQGNFIILLSRYFGEFKVGDSILCTNSLEIFGNITRISLHILSVNDNNNFILEYYCNGSKFPSLFINDFIPTDNYKKLNSFSKDPVYIKTLFSNYCNECYINKMKIK